MARYLPNFVGLDDPEAAHFLCALPNSEAVGVIVDNFAIRIQTGPLFGHLRLPPCDPANETPVLLARLSAAAHQAVNSGSLAGYQQGTDVTAWKVI